MMNVVTSAGTMIIDQKEKNEQACLRLVLDKASLLC